MPRGDFSDDSDFRQAVEQLLESMLDQVDQLETDDIDPMTTPGNLIVRFEDGMTYVLSQQTPTHELWLSAEMKAWHFVCEDGTWVERDSGEPLLQVFTGLMSKRLGMPVKLHLDA